MSGSGPRSVVLDVLNSWPCTHAEIVAETGLASSTVWRALKELAGVIGWRYEPRDEIIRHRHGPMTTRTARRRVYLGPELLKSSDAAARTTAKETP